jgi:Flp pilus assembly protein TadD
MGSAKLGLGLYNEADDYFRNALTLNSEIPQLWTQRAIIAQEKNKHIIALNYLNKAQKLSPNTPEIVLNIAYSNDALGDRNGAILAYREYLSLTQGKTLFVQQRKAVTSRLKELGF